MKYFLTFIIVFLLSAPPVSQATTDDEYRSYLLSVITQLQQQITELQNSINARQAPLHISTAPFESIILPKDTVVRVVYNIKTPEAVRLIENTSQRLFFDRFFTLLPDEYDTHFTELVVFHNEIGEVDAFVETVPTTRHTTWRFGINDEMFTYPVTETAMSELFIHEFAHVLSYESVSDITKHYSSASCHVYFRSSGCPRKNSYLGQFVDTFWGKNDLNNIVRFGSDAWSSQDIEIQFVSDYAAVGPEEDFAETFATFVLTGKPTDDTKRAAKIRFFYDYPELLELRTGIRAEL